MSAYKLTNAAAEDFEGILDFGIDTFGVERAVSYAEGLKDRFEDIAAHPERYPAVDHIAAHTRRSVYGAHAVYYRIEPDHVLIVRVLGQQDVGAAL